MVVEIEGLCFSFWFIMNIVLVNNVVSVFLCEIGEILLFFFRGIIVVDG